MTRIESELCCLQVIYAIMWKDKEIEKKEEIIEKINKSDFDIDDRLIEKALKIGVNKCYIFRENLDGTYELEHKKPYKIIMCRDYIPEEEYCHLGIRCKYVHGDEEEEIAAILKRGYYREHYIRIEREVERGRREEDRRREEMRERRREEEREKIEINSLKNKRDKLSRETRELQFELNESDRKIKNLNKKKRKIEEKCFVC